ncbi:hypothetical protein D3C80_1611850 [compost metagenome]
MLALLPVEGLRQLVDFLPGQLLQERLEILLDTNDLHDGSHAELQRVALFNGDGLEVRPGHVVYKSFAFFLLLMLVPYLSDGIGQLSPRRFGTRVDDPHSCGILICPECPGHIVLLTKLQHILNNRHLKIDIFLFKH